MLFKNKYLILVAYFVFNHSIYASLYDTNFTEFVLGRGYRPLNTLVTEETLNSSADESNITAFKVSTLELHEEEAHTFEVSLEEEAFSLPNLNRATSLFGNSEINSFTRNAFNQISREILKQEHNIVCQQVLNKREISSASNLASSEEKIEYESLLKEEDSRVLVSGTFPSTAIGRLQSFFITPNGKKAYVSVGTGFMISPSCVLTCGHNMTVPASIKREYPTMPPLAQGYKFFPGLRGKKVFYELEVINHKICKEWGQSRNSDFDMGLLLLKNSIGTSVGYIALKQIEDVKNLEEDPLHICGYPAEDEKEDMPYSGNGFIIYENLEGKNSSAHLLFHNIDTTWGNSGSYIATGMQNEPVCIGIHTRGKGIHPNYNSGILMNANKFGTLSRWLKEWGEIKY